MKDLENFINDIRRIADALEKIVTKTDGVIGSELRTKNVQEETVNPITPVSVPVTQIPTAQIPTMQTGIPVAQPVEAFTQEQIARALANATSIGRSDIPQNIFKTFGVQTLMQINPANYSQIAVMLREAGIQI